MVQRLLPRQEDNHASGMADPARENAGAVARTKIDIRARGTKNRAARVLSNKKPPQRRSVSAGFHPRNRCINPEWQAVRPDRPVNCDRIQTRQGNATASNWPDYAGIREVGAKENE